QIDLKPGRYTLRLAAHNADRRKDGSVFVDVDVPDFANLGLSLSGVILQSSNAPVLAASDALKGLIPLVPTTEREFTTSDRVTAFLRVYQGRKGAPGPVNIRSFVLDENSSTVFDRLDTLAQGAFVATNAT